MSFPRTVRLKFLKSKNSWKFHRIPHETKANNLFFHFRVSNVSARTVTWVHGARSPIKGSAPPTPVITGAHAAPTGARPPVSVPRATRAHCATNGTSVSPIPANLDTYVRTSQKTTQWSTCALRRLAGVVTMMTGVLKFVLVCRMMVFVRFVLIFHHIFCRIIWSISRINNTMFVVWAQVRLWFAAKRLL